MEEASDVRDKNNVWMTFSVRVVSYFKRINCKFCASGSKANLPSGK